MYEIYLNVKLKAVVTPKNLTKTFIENNLL